MSQEAESFSESNDVKEQVPDSYANEGGIQHNATVPLEAKITPETDIKPDVQEAESNETINDSSGEHIPV